MRFEAPSKDAPNGEAPNEEAEDGNIMISMPASADSS